MYYNDTEAKIAAKRKFNAQKSSRFHTNYPLNRETPAPTTHWQSTTQSNFVGINHPNYIAYGKVWKEAQDIATNSTKPREKTTDSSDNPVHSNTTLPLPPISSLNYLVHESRPHYAETVALDSIPTKHRKKGQLVKIHGLGQAQTKVASPYKVEAGMPEDLLLKHKSLVKGVKDSPNINAFNSVPNHFQTTNQKWQLYSSQTLI